MFSSSSLLKQEPELSLQSFHQCSSLISIKLSTTNFLLWRLQIIPLIRSLGIHYHIAANERPAKEIMNKKRDKISNPNYQIWVTNDGLLTS